MNKPINHPSLELVASTPTEPIDICPPETEVVEAVVAAAAGDRSAVELERVLRAYEERQAAAKAEADANADWRWWIDPENAPVILCHEQLATAVFIATRGDICFRQQIPGTDDDISVFIRPEHVPALIKRLQQLIR
jgi:hypothetical protein